MAFLSLASCDPVSTHPANTWGSWWDIVDTVDPCGTPCSQLWDQKDQWRQRNKKAASRATPVAWPRTPGHGKTCRRWGFLCTVFFGESSPQHFFVFFILGFHNAHGRFEQHRAKTAFGPENSVARIANHGYEWQRTRASR
jgi:hypothetical protein